MRKRDSSSGHEGGGGIIRTQEGGREKIRTRGRKIILTEKIVAVNGDKRVSRERGAGDRAGAGFLWSGAALGP